MIQIMYVHIKLYINAKLAVINMKNDRNTSLLQQVYNSPLTWGEPHTMWGPPHERAVVKVMYENQFSINIVQENYRYVGEVYGKSNGIAITKTTVHIYILHIYIYSLLRN
jgi:hypothetical protein